MNALVRYECTWTDTVRFVLELLYVGMRATFQKCVQEEEYEMEAMLFGDVRALRTSAVRHCILMLSVHRHFVCPFCRFHLDAAR